MTQEPKPRRVSVELGEDEHRAIRVAAAELDEPLKDFLRQAGLERAQRIAADKQRGAGEAGQPPTSEVGA